MFRQILLTHWKNVRIGLLPLCLLSFGLPILSVQGLGGLDDQSLRSWGTSRLFIEVSEAWVPLFPILATVLGATLALSAWSWDHKGQHVYSLALPLARWEYALLKMAAGGVLLAVPVTLFWAGALVASNFLTLPPGFQAYPTLLAGRFVLASFIIYAFASAFAAGTMRTTMVTLSAVIGAVVLGSIVTSALATLNPELRFLSFGQMIIESLTAWPGPFEVFTGNWMLIDV